jgi:hypothetical protein
VTRAKWAAAAIIVIGAAAPTLFRRVGDDTTRVVAVHPGAHQVPSNLLRVYVEFSAPMETDWASTHVRLLDESGRVVPRAFLEMDPELWDSSHRRLTMLFDPGRVKRGIRSNLEMGAPLVAGRRYTIVVDSGWRDDRATPLVRSFNHELVVGAFDGTSPDPHRWVLSSPRVATRDSLVVRFDEPLDHGLAARMIIVVDASGAAIGGAGMLGDADRLWTFVPRLPWPARALSLRVNPALEDLAGNSVARPFDSYVTHGGRRAEDAVDDAVVIPIPSRS